MDFRLLGPLEVADDGHPLVLGGVKQRLVLALLLLHANQACPPTACLKGSGARRPPPRLQRAFSSTSHGCAGSWAKADWRRVRPVMSCASSRQSSTSRASSACSPRPGER